VVVGADVHIGPQAKTGPNNSPLWRGGGEADGVVIREEYYET